MGIVTILNKPSGLELLLQRQYRPPIDAICIEMPAGLVDKGETAEQSAVRELKEETGYVGVAEKTSPIMYNGMLSFFCTHALLSGICILTKTQDPGFCNTNQNMVHVSVDMALPENQNPKPELEENEFIECFSVPLGSLFGEYMKWERQGYAIDARVGTMVEGIELAKRLKI